MKTYVKPELFFEDFELAQYIAACGLKVPANESKCYFEVGGSKVFLTNNGPCTIDAEDIGYCYFPGSGSHRGFDS